MRQQKKNPQENGGFDGYPFINRDYNVIKFQPNLSDIVAYIHYGWQKRGRSGYGTPLFLAYQLSKNIFYCTSKSLLFSDVATFMFYRMYRRTGYLTYAHTHAWKGLCYRGVSAQIIICLKSLLWTIANCER